MTGTTDYTAKALLNYVTGQKTMPTLPSVWVGLFTAVGTDAGTGFTEVTGGSYARVQVAGPLTTNGATTTASPTISIASVPSWVKAGMSVYDATTAQIIGTVLSTAASTVTLTANAASAVGSGDVLNFSAWPQATGTAPSSLLNGAIVQFAQATVTWGTAIAWGLFDAATVGNLTYWDYLGSFAWLPVTMSAASPSTFTSPAHGYSAADSFVFTTEYGGTAPTVTGGSLSGLQTIASVATDTFTVTGLNTSTTGDGLIRKVASQSIPSGVAASFAANTFSLSQA